MIHSDKSIDITNLYPSIQNICIILFAIFSCIASASGRCCVQKQKRPINQPAAFLTRRLRLVF